MKNTGWLLATLIFGLGACSFRTGDGGPEDLPLPQPIPGECPAIFLGCPMGSIQADSDRDGCIDSCAPVNCDDAPRLLCEGGAVLIDKDGDGCGDYCGYDHDDPLPCDAIACDPDSRGIDTNRDGCIDKCVAIECPPIAISCKPGSRPVDGNYDGCVDTCGTNACKMQPGTALGCPGGLGPTEFVDTTGDGICDICASIECKIAIKCGPGYLPVDSDGDRCADTCKPQACPPAPRCIGAYDSDKDGCIDACPKPNDCGGVVVVCNPGATPIDTDKDGCYDGCLSCAQILCAPGGKPFDSNGDGCDDKCAYTGGPGPTPPPEVDAGVRE